jgi:hypothetical protein
MGGRRRCCCGCLEYTDDFGRSDSTNLGERWSEKLGDWEIDTEHLVEAGTLSAKLLFLLPMPTAAMIVAIDTIDEAVGDKYKIYIGHDHPDEENPNSYWVTFEVVLDEGQRKANLAAGYNDTTLRTASLVPLTGTSRTFGACLAGGYIIARVGGTPCVDQMYGYGLPALAEQPGGRYAGVGNPGGTAITLDNWWISDHYAHNKNCPDCPIACCGMVPWAENFPLSLTLTIFSQTCPLLDGVEIELLYSAGEGSQCGATWIGTWNPDPAENPPYIVDVTFSCSTNEFEEQYWELRWLPRAFNEWPPPPTCPSNDIITPAQSCFPFVWYAHHDTWLIPSPFTCNMDWDPEQGMPDCNTWAESGGSGDVELWITLTADESSDSSS